MNEVERNFYNLESLFKFEALSHSIQEKIDKLDKEFAIFKDSEFTN
jgi:hypothetical protein